MSSTARVNLGVLKCRRDLKNSVCLFVLFDCLEFFSHSEIYETFILFVLCSGYVKQTRKMFSQC
jgi:hypothetical protein